MTAVNGRMQRQKSDEEQGQLSRETIKSSERHGNGVAEDCAGGTVGVIAYIAAWLASGCTG